MPTHSHRPENATTPETAPAPQVAPAAPAPSAALQSAELTSGQAQVDAPPADDAAAPPADANDAPANRQSAELAAHPPVGSAAQQAADPAAQQAADPAAQQAADPAAQQAAVPSADEARAAEAETGIPAAPEGAEAATDAAAAATPAADAPGVAVAPAPAAAEQGTAGPAGSPAPAGPAAAPQAAGPAAAIDPAARTSVQDELTFHESWSQMAGQSRGQRAAALLGRSVGTVGAGLAGGALQAGVGAGVGALAQRAPVPGVANVIGGVMSGVWLFGGGAAGTVADMGQSLTNLADPSASPLLKAADVVALVKGFLDLVGNVCNVLSGLAYVFAGLAALGGLLSVFCPPLAFLVPYIPTAINFGRLCGGIGTAALGVSSLISPLPPLLRALHIVTSNDDPVRLVAEENRYHGELRGAVAAYASAGIAGGVGAAGQARTGGATRGAALGAGLRAGLNPMNQARGVAAPIRPGLGDARAAGADLRAGSPQAAQATGMAGQSRAELRTPDAAQARGRDYLTGGNARRLEAELAATGQQQGAARDRLADETAQQGQARSNLAAAQARTAASENGKSGRGAVKRRTNNLARATEAVERTQGELESLNGVARGQQNRHDLARGLVRDDRGELGAQGDSGNAADGLWTMSAPGGPGPDAPQEIERNEQGNVVLPTPPGSLQEIDAFDTQIAELEASLQTQQATTQETQATAAQTQADAGALEGVQVAVTERVETLAAGEAEHQRVAQANTEARAQTQAEGGNAQGQLQEAAQILQPIAGPARTVNGLVQRVPSNRYFNVSSTQRNMAEFISAIDEITGQDQTQQGHQQEALACIDARDTQVAEAGTLHGETNAEAATLAQTVAADQVATAATAAELQQAGAASAQAEQTVAQQLQAAREQKQQKWSALEGWASRHLAVRTATIGRRA